MCNVIFSCEIGSREFIPRLLLAAELQKVGYNIIIGHKFSISRLLERIDGRKSGIFFHKDASTDSHKYMSNAKRIGLTTVGLDEEFVNWDEPYEPKHFVTEASSGAVDFFFASTRKTELLARAAGINVIGTGNLRFALCEEIRKNSELFDKQGAKKILLNSPGGYLFNYYPLVTHLEIWSRLSETGWREPYRKLKEFIFDELAVADKVLELANIWCQSGESVTVRTHPAESPKFWSNMLAGFPLEVKPGIDSSILAMLDYDEVHGFDCTTLLEAHLLGKTTVNYGEQRGRTSKTIVRRLLDGRHDQLNGCGHLVSGLDEVLILGGILNNWISSIRNLSENAVSSYDLIVPVGEDRVGSMPADVDLRKGHVSDEAIERLRRLPRFADARFASAGGDFFYFPRLI